MTLNDIPSTLIPLSAKLNVLTQSAGGRWHCSFSSLSRRRGEDRYVAAEGPTPEAAFAEAVRRWTEPKPVVKRETIDISLEDLEI